MANKPEEKLTKEQIENWRKVLSLDLGFIAESLSDEMIQKYRDNMQRVIDRKRVEVK